MEDSKEEKPEKEKRPIINLEQVTKLLETEQGKRLVDMIQGVIDRSQKNGDNDRRRDTHWKYAIATAAVSGGCILSYADKFDSSIAVLLGSVIGYVLSKRPE